MVTSERSLPHAVGIDIGTARTKIAVGRAVGPDPPRVHVLPTVCATGRNGGRSGEAAYALADEPGVQFHDGRAICASGDALFARFLGGLVAGPGSVMGADPGATSLVVAVPDAWVGAVADELRLRLIEHLGFGDVRMVSETLCVAARAADLDGGPQRVRLICDVGVRSVTAAVCVFDGAAVRLLDVESVRLPPHATLDAVLLDRYPAQARARLAHALHEERLRHNHRAQLVLERVGRDPAYAQTPVYFLPNGRTVSGEALADALDAVQTSAADVIDRLWSRTGLSGSDVIVTGGTVFPVVDRVRKAARAEGTVTLDPTGAACGAQWIAAGRVTAADGYPHVLGFAVRLIRHGMLESATVEIAGAVPAPVPLVVIVEPGEELAVRWKPNGRGDWEVVRPAPPVRVPAGTYRVETQTRRSGAASLLLHGQGSARTVTLELPAAPDGGR